MLTILISGLLLLCFAGRVAAQPTERAAPAAAQSLSPDDVLPDKQPKQDSLWNGLLIGAAAGTAPAVYWRFADPNECGNSICTDDLAIGMVIGAGIGLAIDALIHPRTAIDRASSNTPARRTVSAAPIVAGRRKGIAMSLAF